jgi:homospermidine synthase
MILLAHTGHLVLVGFGSVGCGLLPLIFRHIAIDRARITVVTAGEDAAAAARRHGVNVLAATVTQENYRALLAPLLSRDGILVNLGLHVASAPLIELCQEAGALYLDSGVEPWPDVYRNAGLPPAQRTSHALRQSLHDRVGGKRGPTALVGHGANPGLVSHFTKAALVRLATDTLEGFTMPRSQAQWASLARTLGVKVIHVTERDTQAAAVASAPGEFVNTWSPEGLIDELCQPAEFGWGTHERNVPPDASVVGYEASR